MLATQQIRWLVDGNLPQIEGEHPDVLPINQCGRDVMTEALRNDRWVITANRNLLEARTIPFHCPPIVIINGEFYTEEGLRRNLLHFEFSMLHETDNRPATGQRFLIDLDRAIYRIRPEGGLQEIETWKTPSVKGVLAWGASA